MNTNSIAQVQDWMVYARDLSISFLSAGPEISCLAICWIVGIVLKMCDWHKVKWKIPVAIIFVVGPVSYVLSYFFGLNSGANIPQGVMHAWIGKSLDGIKLGFVTWVLHRAFLKKFEDKFLFDKEGNTKFFPKPTNE